MESRSEHSPPEKQGWNAQYYTAQPQGRAAQTDTAAHDAALTYGAAVSSEVCARVREQLQSLLENDGSVQPEAATALYGHVAICAECARELEAMQRVVHMLEALPMAELPTDYSRLVMRRLQVAEGPPAEVSTVRSVGLCDRVREKLQPLLEQDPGISPELAAELHKHLAGCGECASVYSGLTRMVNLLETLPAVELPIDYSLQIMRRIQTGAATTSRSAEAAAVPTFAASSRVSEGVATHEMLSAKDRLAATLRTTGAMENRQTATQRLVASVALCGMFVYLLASDWGRQMLSVNVEAARVWLAQIGEHLGRVPVFGAIVLSLTAALAGVNEALSHTFAALGGMAAQTLALEVSLGLAACLVIQARRRVAISGI